MGSSICIAKSTTQKVKIAADPLRRLVDKRALRTGFRHFIGTKSDFGKQPK